LYTLFNVSTVSFKEASERSPLHQSFLKNKNTQQCTRDAQHHINQIMVFLLVNLIGFAGYYIHPAAPPWYAMNYGFEPILDTPGNVAGLGRFDELLGCSIFNSIYGRNANVFAAVPSLHAAYMVVALAYAPMHRLALQYSCQRQTL
jgi:hypothetical protein